MMIKKGNTNNLKFSLVFGVLLIFALLMNSCSPSKGGSSSTKKDDPVVPQEDFDLNISSTENTITNDANITLEFNFDEEVIEFEISDIVTTNGSITSLTGEGKSYTANFEFNSEGSAGVSVAAGVTVDKTTQTAENNAAGFSIVYDSVSPGVEISGPINDGETAGSHTIIFSATFTEDVSGFDINDINVTNATLLGVDGSGDEYTFSVYHENDADVTIDIPADNIEDQAGNTNTSDSFSYTYSATLASVNITSASDSITNDNPVTLDINFGVSMDDKALTVDDLTVINGSAVNFTGDVDSCSVEIIPSSIGNVTVSIAEGILLSSTGQKNMSASFDFEYDNVAPSAPTVDITNDPVNKSNDQAFGFLITNGVSGNRFDYTISDGSNIITGNDVLDSSGNFTKLGMDVSTLDDGTITLNVTQTDDAGNESNVSVDSVLKDTNAPETLTVTITSSDPVTSAANENFGFTITGGIDGLPYEYKIQSNGGTAIINGSDIFDSSGSIVVTNLNISSLKDGSITVSAFQVDDAGNKSDSGYDVVTLDTVAVNEPEFDTDVDPTNVTDFDFVLYGEHNSVYDYIIKSSAGGTPVTGSGVFDETGIEYIAGLDLSGLADGYLILIVNVTDPISNTSTSVKVVEKSSIVPDTGIADFSGEASAVSFDACYHGTQSIPSGPVKYDTKNIIGSDYADIIKFTELEDGETFTVNGGSSNNVLDLSNYSSVNVTVSAGAFTEDSGTITIDLGSSESAVINYTNFSYIKFSSNNFTGSPHAIDLNTLNGTTWSFNNTTFETTSPNGSYKLAVLYYEGSLDLNYQLDTSFLPYNDASYKNGLIIFDYQNENNYKYIRAYALADRWEIGEVISGSASGLATLNENIDETSENYMQLKVTGVDGKTAELWSGGVKKVEYVFDDVLNDGTFGLTNVNAHTKFTIDMSPSNWAPYAKEYDVRVSHTAGVSVTLDLISDAVDFESEEMTLVSISGGEGSLINNGDGTVTYQIPDATFYGADVYTYQITDGKNVTEGKIRFDVVP